MSEFPEMEYKPIDGEGLEVAPNATPLEFLQAIYRSAAQPMHRRMKAAVEAAQYAHPKLAATAVLTSEDFAERLERAIARSGVKLIEAKAQVLSQSG